MYQDRFLNAMTSARRSVEDEFLQACESGKVEKVTQLLSEYDALQVNEINGFVSRHYPPHSAHTLMPVLLSQSLQLPLHQALHTVPFPSSTQGTRTHHYLISYLRTCSIPCMTWNRIVRARCTWHAMVVTFPSLNCYCDTELTSTPLLAPWKLLSTRPPTGVTCTL